MGDGSADRRGLSGEHEEESAGIIGNIGEREKAAADRRSGGRSDGGVRGGVLLSVRADAHTDPGRLQNPDGAL